MKIVFIPAFIFLVGSLFIPLFKEWPRKIYIMLLPVLGFVNLLMIKPGTVYKFKFLDFTIIPLQADKLSLIVGYIFIIIGFFALLYTLHVKENTHHILGIWYMGTSLGAVFAGDLLTLYIFWELIAISSTGLILQNKDEEARSAAFRYLIMHLIGGLLLLGGIWLHYLNTGSLLVTQFKAGLPFVLFLAGTGVNAAFVLLHTWLPDAYPRAPFTASVFMSVYTTKTAVYLLARTAPGWDFVAYMGAAMAVFGVTMALMQNNARKLLSYHIVSQVGYMVAAIGLGGAFGVDGGIFHLFNHILYKALLFMTIGAVIYVTGKENLNELGGLSRKMPITTTAAIVASLSISGVPLFNGFVSKALIFKAAHVNDIIYLMLELAVIGTFLSFLKFTYYGFLRPNKKMEAIAHEAPVNMTAAMGGVAFLCVAIGIFPTLVTNILPFASTLTFYSSENILGISQLIAVSLVAFSIGTKNIFVPHKRLTFDFDLFYLKFIEGLSIVPRTFSRLNDWFEETTEKIPYYLSLTKKPVLTSTNYLSDLMFAIWVDFWLVKPTAEMYSSESKTKLPLVDSLIFRPFNWLVALLGHVGNRLSKISARIDSLVVDRAAQEAANILFSNEVTTPLKKFEKRVINELTDEAATMIYGNVMSSSAKLFDKIIVDGVVDGVAKVIFFVGERARHIQTGFVQNYALIMVFVVAILIFILSIKGGLT